MSIFGLDRSNVPAGTYRPRNQESFRTKINHAQGITARNAQEAQQLLSLVGNYLSQIDKFLGNQTQAEIIRRNRENAAAITGLNVNQPVRQVEAKEPEPVKAASTETVPEEIGEKEVYSEAEEQARIEQLIKAKNQTTGRAKSQKEGAISTIAKELSAKTKKAKKSIPHIV